MLVTMLVSTMVFSACGDDDDKEKSMVGKINTMLTGGWRGQPVTGSGMIICKFGNDGSIGVAVSNASGNYTEQNGTYTFTGLSENGVVTARWNDGTSEEMPAGSITSTSMYLKKGNVNYKLTRADLDDDEEKPSGGGSGSNVCHSCRGTGQCQMAGLGCYGTGKCGYCNGRGYTGSGSFTFTCTLCKGARTCKYCGGDGICSTCGGTGLRY